MARILIKCPVCGAQIAARGEPNPEMAELGQLQFTLEQDNCECDYGDFAAKFPQDWNGFAQDVRMRLIDVTVAEKIKEQTQSDLNDASFYGLGPLNNPQGKAKQPKPLTSEDLKAAFEQLYKTPPPTPKQYPFPGAGSILGYASHFMMTGKPNKPRPSTAPFTPGWLDLDAMRFDPSVWKGFAEAPTIDWRY